MAKAAEAKAKAHEAKAEGELQAALKRRHTSTGELVDVKTEKDEEMFARLSKQREAAESGGIVIETSSDNPVTLGLLRGGMGGMAPGTMSAAQEWEVRKAKEKEAEEKRARLEAEEAAKDAEVRAAEAAAKATQEQKEAKAAAEAAAAEAAAAKVRHGAQGQRIDINTERDEGMFAILEKQKRGSFRTGPEGAQSASVNIRGTSVEVMEVEARQWLSAVLRSGGKEGGADKLDGVGGGGVPPPLQEVLKDGVMLCDLMNVLHKPPSTADGAAAAHLEAGCPTPSTSHLPFKQMENIAAYLKACKSLVAAYDLSLIHI